MSQIWFRFRDARNKSYYWNSQTEHTQWRFPPDALVYDAVTKRRLKLPGGLSPRSPSPRQSPTPSEAAPSSPRQAIAPSAPQEESEPSISEDVPLCGPEIPDYSYQLVESYANMTFKPDDFIKKNINKPKTGFSFSEKAIDQPLLMNVKKSDAKAVLKNYKLIMKLTGCNKVKESGEIINLVKKLKESKDLIDEVFVEVWKQTIEAPTAAMSLGLQLLTTLVSLFLPSQFLRVPLLHHIATIAKNSEAARFILIRFDAAVRAGKPPLSFTSDKDINLIPNHPNSSQFYFGVSPYEIFWHQRRTRPRCPVPYSLYKIIDQIDKSGGRSLQNIFRNQGNTARISELAKKANRGDEFLDGENINDIAGLLKQWFNEIPGHLVDSSYAAEWKSLNTEEAMIQFADKLAIPYRSSLKYLVGYLRDLAQCSATTQMDMDKLSSAFCSFLTFDDNSNPIIFQQSQKLFLMTLIKSWDVSEVYPVQPGQVRMVH